MIHTYICLHVFIHVHVCKHVHVHGVCSPAQLSMTAHCMPIFFPSILHVLVQLLYSKTQVQITILRWSEHTLNSMFHTRQDAK